MKKKDLLELGLTEEQIEKVLNWVDSEFIPQSKYATLEESLKALKDQLNVRDDQLKQLQKDSKASFELKEMIQNLQDQNHQMKEEYESKINELNLNSTIELEVLKSGALLPKAVFSYLDRSKLFLDANGAVQGLAEQLDQLKQGDTSILFKSSTPVKEGFVPETSAPNKSTSFKDPSEMTYEDWCQLYPNS